MLGINQGFSPRFLRRYANLGEEITRAVQAYIEDVKSQDFPNEKEQYWFLNLPKHDIYRCSERQGL